MQAPAAPRLGWEGGMLPAMTLKKVRIMPIILTVCTIPPLQSLIVDNSCFVSASAMHVELPLRPSTEWLSCEMHVRSADKCNMQVSSAQAVSCGR